MKQHSNPLFEKLFVIEADQWLDHPLMFSDSLKKQIDLQQRYTLLRQYLTETKHTSDEELAAWQVASYSQRTTPFHRAQNRFFVGVAYYEQGRRLEARRELQTLCQELADETIQYLELKLNVALLLAAAGDCNAAVRVITWLEKAELRAELLPFFWQLQHNHSQISENRLSGARTTPRAAASLESKSPLPSSTESLSTYGIN